MGITTRNRSKNKREAPSSTGALDATEVKRLKVEMNDHPVAADDNDNSNDMAAKAGPTQGQAGLDTRTHVGDTGAVKKPSRSGNARTTGTKGYKKNKMASMKRNTGAGKKASSSGSARTTGTKVHKNKASTNPAPYGVIRTAGTKADSTRRVHYSMQQESASDASSKRGGFSRAWGGGEAAVAEAAPAMAATAEAGSGWTPAQTMTGAVWATQAEGEQRAAGVDGVGDGNGDGGAEVTVEPHISEELEEFLKAQRVVWAQRKEQARRDNAAFRAAEEGLGGTADHVEDSCTQEWEKAQFVAAYGNRGGAKIAEGLRGAWSGYREGAPSAGGAATATAGIGPLVGLIPAVVRRNKK